MIYPLFTKVTLAGHDPLIVNAGVDTLSDQIYTPEATVIVAALVPFHPLANAQVLKLSSF
jgi:hypothetical protein